MTLCNQLWYQAAVEAFYKMFILRPRQIQNLQSKFKRNPPPSQDEEEKGHQQEYNFGRYVVKLKMVGLLRDYRYMQYYDNPGHEYCLWYSYSQTVFKQDEFTRLLGLLPNLKILDLKDSIKPEHYMKYLQDINSCQHLQHIKKITANYIGYHLNSIKQTAKKQLYLSTYRSFASTLTSLELSCSVGVFSQDDLSILCEFKKLMELSLDRPQAVSIMLSDILDFVQN